jgi:hypothetical protein
MSPIELILFIVVAGVALWLINMIPMDATIKQILHWVVVAIVVIVVVLWFFALFGVSLQTLNRPMRIN